MLNGCFIAVDGQGQGVEAPQTTEGSFNFENFAVSFRSHVLLASLHRLLCNELYEQFIDMLDVSFLRSNITQR